MRSKFNPGDLVKIKKHCKIAGQVGIIIKSYYGVEHDLIMVSCDRNRDLEKNIDVAGET